MFNSARARDNRIASELAEAELTGNLPNMRNGIFDRERRSVQRRGWSQATSMARSALKDHFRALEEERAAGITTKKASLDRQKVIDTRLRELRSTHWQRRSAEANQEIDNLESERRHGKTERDVWDQRQKVITEEMAELRNGELKNVRLKGARPDLRQQVNKENGKALYSHITFD